MLDKIQSNYMRALDLADYGLCRIGLRPTATWDTALRQPVTRLYAGKLRRGLPQWKTHIGLTPFFPNSRNIPHDIHKPHELPDNSVYVYQSEDVFEHISLSNMPAIVDDIYRILAPGGIFRLCLPDYRFSVYRDRTLKDEQGLFVFDPGGGGQLIDGEVTGGGHVWFPTFEVVRDLLESSPFGRDGHIEFLHYNAPDGATVLKRIDYSLGNVQRTPDHDPRGTTGEAISIVVDARKAQ